MSRRGRGAIGLVAVWAVALVAAATWSAHHDPATVRTQSDLASGRQRLDEAVATVAEAVGPGVAVEIRPYEVVSGCRVTLARRGTEVGRTVALTVPVGEEVAVLRRLAAELPEHWVARYHEHSNRFFADAGEFVALRGQVVEPGKVELTADTGCRPGADPELFAPPDD
jgi:hypothetical protein